MFPPSNEYFLLAPLSPRDYYFDLYARDIMSETRGNVEDVKAMNNFHGGRVYL